MTARTFEDVLAVVNLAGFLYLVWRMAEIRLAQRHLARWRSMMADVPTPGVQPARDRGFVVAGPLKYDITSIELVDGKFEIIARRYGPNAEPFDAYPTVFDPKGHGVYQGTVSLHVPKLAPSDKMELVLTGVVNSVEPASDRQKGRPR